MFAQTLDRWLRRSPRAGKKANTVRSPRWRRLGLERLEDRVVLDSRTFVQYGNNNLTFMSSIPQGFVQETNGNY
jgi:hypothetical protein